VGSALAAFATTGDGRVIVGHVLLAVGFDRGSGAQRLGLGRAAHRYAGRLGDDVESVVYLLFPRALAVAMPDRMARAFRIVGVVAITLGIVVGYDSFFRN
jgi:hypothetical protein